MSLPTLRNDLSKIYEPKAPAPLQRLATLRAAREAGLNVYVTVAPTYPECDEADFPEFRFRLGIIHPAVAGFIRDFPEPRIRPQRSFLQLI